MAQGRYKEELTVFDEWRHSLCEPHTPSCPIPLPARRFSLQGHPSTHLPISGVGEKPGAIQALKTVKCATAHARAPHTWGTGRTLAHTKLLQTLNQ